MISRNYNGIFYVIVLINLDSRVSRLELEKSRNPSTHSDQGLSRSVPPTSTCSHKEKKMRGLYYSFMRQ